MRTPKICRPKSEWDRAVKVCLCEDDNGTVCGKPLTKEEFEQDGMCGACADWLWEENFDV